MPDHDETLWYFAYGSNMSPGTFSGRRNIQPLETRWGWLHGYDLRFDLPVGAGERACANITAQPGARIAGVLYRITREAADHLDRTEGVPQGVYRRIDVEVAVGAGQEELAAFTYQSSLGTPGRKPSARYLGLLLDGARAHDLPADYVTWLEGFDLALDERLAPERPREQRVVRFYFAYNSPYAFLANSRLAHELAAFDVSIEYTPVYSPRSGGAPDFASPRLRYMAEDVRRFADAYGLELKVGPFADSGSACRGFLYARAEGRAKAYHDSVYAARFLEGRDIADVDTLAAVAARAGLARRCFLAALDDASWAAALAACNEAASADGVFGVPFFVFNGQRFWGNDRIEWLVRAIRATTFSAPSPAGAIPAR